MRAWLLGTVLLAQLAWGEGMPGCRLTDLNGHAQTLPQGKVVYLDFWASWCSSCAHSFPFMNALTEDLGKRGLAVVAVNLDENLQEAKAFLDRHPPRFFVLLDPHGECARAFSVEGMPATYLIDRTGQVRYRHIGFRPGDSKVLKAKVEELLAESE
ncbi:MAG: TlpA family protein disulfide reductase [Methylohalobius sp.]|nr:TlpA family protein disulfide reductase [Methylohalobius sp.]